MATNTEQVVEQALARHAADANAHGPSSAAGLQTHDHSGGSSGVQLSHGGLINLDQDDHGQYAITISGSRLQTAISGARDGDHLEYDESSGHWVAANGLIRATGFPSDQAGDYLTTLTYSITTRTWTVLPIAPATTFDVFVKGVRHTFASITATHPATVGLHFLYIDIDGSVVVATSAWSLIHDAPVSATYWDGTLGLPFDERHHAGRDVWWHANQHRLEGTKAGSGFGISGYTLNTGSSDTAITWALASGTVEDEDIAVTTAAIADNGPYTLMYRTGSGSWVFSTAASLPLLHAASALQYNAESGGTWSLAAVPDERWCNYWVFALTTLPAASITGWPASPTQIILVPGQAVYTSDALAHAESVSTLSWGTMPFMEIAPLYQITFRSNTSPAGAGGPAYTNTARCAITRIVRVIGSASIITQSAQTDHGSLTGLSDDDHLIYIPVDASRTADGIYFARISDTNPTDILYASDGAGALPAGSLVWTGPLVTYGAAYIGNPGSEQAGVVVDGTTYDAQLMITDQAAGNQYAAIIHRHSSTASDGASLLMARSKATGASHSAVSVFDTVGAIDFVAHDGTDYVPAAQIRVTIDGTPGTNDMPGRLSFWITPDGSATPVEVMRINSEQRVDISGALAASSGTVTTAVQAINTGGGLAIAATGNCSITGAITATGGVDKLTTTTGAVSVASSAAPSAGDYLKASDATTAAWAGLAADVRSVTLTGLSLASSADITSADSILSAFGKIQAQIDAIGTSGTRWEPVAYNGEILFDNSGDVLMREAS